MRWVAFLLGILLVALQYRLWFGDGGVMENHRLQERLVELQHRVQRQQERNQALAAEVWDLKHNLAAVEERARRDLGMIRPGETYVMVVEQP